MLSMSAVAVVISFIAMVVSNVLSQKKVFGGTDNKTLSDKNPTYLTPDGKTFAVWGFIYLFELILTVAQAIPSDETEELLGQVCPLTGLDVRERLVLAFLANAVWLPCFNYERYYAALAVMVAYLAFLLSLYSSVNVTTVDSIKDRLLFTPGIAMNASWIVVATFVNLFMCLGNAGWKDEHGVAGSAPVAAVVVLLVAGVGSCLGIFFCDVAWTCVSAWALSGINRMQTIPDKVRFPLSAMSSTVGACAVWGSRVALLSLLVGVGLALHTRFG